MTFAKIDAATKLKALADAKTALASAEAAEAAAMTEVSAAKALVKASQSVFAAAKKTTPLDQPKVDAALASVATTQSSAKISADELKEATKTALKATTTAKEAKKVYDVALKV